MPTGHPDITLRVPKSFDHTAVITLHRGNFKIGKALLSRQGAVARLADIIITDVRAPVVSWFPFIKVRRNYRGKGYGTHLLNTVIAFCREHGIEEIVGQAAGDIERLLPWYRRMGFSVAQDQGISMRLT